MSTAGKPPDPDVVARVRALIDRLPGSGPRRAAVLGDSADAWAPLLRARGFEVTCPSDPLVSGLPDMSQHVIVAVGALERLAWDRWALQLAHRALANGGYLIVAVPNFSAVTSLGDLVFLGRRAARELVARARRAWGLPPRRERFRTRRYRRAGLERTIESLGFSVELRSSHGFGALAPMARLFPRAIDGLGRTHVLLCRRGPSLYGVEGRSYPDAASHRQAFERARGRDVADLERWLERHPRFRPERVEAFDPAAYQGANVLVLAPHPDDELIGCGGTLARLVVHGAHVTVLHATDGSEAASLWHAPADVRHTVRLEEARRVGAIMGFESLVFWGEDNAAFRASDQRVSALAGLLDQLRPSLIFAPFVTDVHPDHRTLNSMLARALRSAVATQDSLVLNYQVWSLAPPNLYCDITGVVEAQERALWLYETAMKVDDYVHFCQDRNVHDAHALTGQHRYVEAFFAISARAYPDLVAAGEEPDA